MPSFATYAAWSSQSPALFSLDPQVLINIAGRGEVVLIVRAYEKIANHKF